MIIMFERSSILPEESLVKPRGYMAQESGQPPPVKDCYQHLGSENYFPVILLVIHIDSEPAQDPCHSLRSLDKSSVVVNG